MRGKYQKFKIQKAKCKIRAYRDDIIDLRISNGIILNASRVNLRHRYMTIRVFENGEVCIWNEPEELPVLRGH